MNWGGGMPYLWPAAIMTAGILLVLIFTPLAWRHGREAQAGDIDTGGTSTEVDFLLEQLHSLEKEISSLKNGMAAAWELPSPPRQAADCGGSQGGGAEKSFPALLQEQQKTEPLPDIELYRAVFQAYDSGKNVTEIARELGRGKGEVQLILNLRR